MVRVMIISDVYKDYTVLALLSEDVNMLVMISVCIEERMSLRATMHAMIAEAKVEEKVENPPKCGWWLVAGG